MGPQAVVLEGRVERRTLGRLVLRRWILHSVRNPQQDLEPAEALECLLFDLPHGRRGKLQKLTYAFEAAERQEKTNDDGQSSGPGPSRCRHWVRAYGPNDEHRKTARQMLTDDGTNNRKTCARGPMEEHSGSDSRWMRNIEDK